MSQQTTTTDGYFGPGLFRFLKDLKTHNEREWFRANQQRYENDVRGPFLDYGEASRRNRIVSP